MKETARRTAALAIVVLVLGAGLFGGAWLIGGQDAVSDNWVGVTVVLALFLGLFGSFAAGIIAVSAGLRHEPWSQLWLPLATFPAVVTIVALLGWLGIGGIYGLKDRRSDLRRGMSATLERLAVLVEQPTAAEQ